ncbi:DUF4124 domain-containing protein [Noviherbaspirillum cavernae]|nr:DUF4124 domain-containing protein [Noviherbaspirillum cavernae]
MMRTALLSLLVSVSAPVFAIYKCDVNGKVTYSDETCPGGKALNINSMPSTDGTAAKRQLTEDEKKLKRLEDQRHKREAREEREQNQIARANAAQRKKCSSLAQRKRWADEDFAATAGKASEKARIKARRAGEQYNLECGL